MISGSLVTPSIFGDREAVDVGVEDADVVALTGQGHGQVDRHRRLAHPALARRDPEDPGLRAGQHEPVGPALLVARAGLHRRGRGRGRAVVGACWVPPVHRLAPEQHPQPGPGLLVHHGRAPPPPRRPRGRRPPPAGPAPPTRRPGGSGPPAGPARPRPACASTWTGPTMPNSPSGRRSSGSVTAATAAVTWDSSMDIGSSSGEFGLTGRLGDVHRRLGQPLASSPSRHEPAPGLRRAEAPLTIRPSPTATSPPR